VTSSSVRNQGNPEEVEYSRRSSEDVSRDSEAEEVRSWEEEDDEDEQEMESTLCTEDAEVLRRWMRPPDS
jgi:hypothetical protein